MCAADDAAPARVAVAARRLVRCGDGDAMLGAGVTPVIRDNVEQGVLGRGLAYIKVGSGAPVVVAAGLLPDHRPLRGLERRIQLRELRPLAAASDRLVGEPSSGGWTRTRAWRTSRDDYADALRRSFDGPVDVIGISTGGSVALQLAADHPEVIRRLVVAASGSRLGARGRQEQRDLADRVRAGRPRAAAAEAIGTAGATPVSRAVLGAAGWLMGARCGRSTSRTTSLVTIEAEDRFDLTGRLGEIRVPVLVVGGTRDRGYDDGRGVHPDRRSHPGRRRLILYPGKGHLVFWPGKQMPRDALAFLAEDTSQPAAGRPRATPPGERQPRGRRVSPVLAAAAARAHCPGHGRWIAARGRRARCAVGPGSEAGATVPVAETWSDLTASASVVIAGSPLGYVRMRPCVRATCRAVRVNERSDAGAQRALVRLSIGSTWSAAPRGVARSRDRATLDPATSTV